MLPDLLITTLGLVGSFDELARSLNTASGYDEELRNWVFFERDLQATSICGAVGAAVAVEMLQGQDEAGIASAAGIAASIGRQPAGGQPHRRDHQAGPLRLGRACGVAAADLARHGLTGPPTVLEGRFGFLQASRTPSLPSYA